MKLALMQPYLFPYIGYFQLMAAVDLFIVYDNIKYTKKGWINRNRFLLGGRDDLQVGIRGEPVAHRRLPFDIVRGAPGQ